MIDFDSLNKYIESINNNIRMLEFQTEINNFISIFYTCMEEEGWQIITSMSIDGSWLYTVEHIYAVSFNLGKLTLDKDFLDNIRDYGIVVSNEGIVIDIKLENVKKNKHLLTANELGLI